MSTYVLTAHAEADLRHIVDYIARDSFSAALRVLDELHASMEQLAAMPYMGHRRDDLADETLLVWPIYTYVIIYRPETTPLQIIRVLSAFQNIGKLMR